jgi:hypothetical protein
MIKIENEWQDMFCVEKHGILTKGVKYKVRKLNKFTMEVQVRGRLIYEDPRYFQFNKPIVKQEEENESEYYDTY